MGEIEKIEVTKAKERKNDRYGYLITGLTGSQVSEISKVLIEKFKNNSAVHTRMLVYTPEMAKSHSFYQMDLRKTINVGGQFNNQDVLFIAPPDVLTEFCNKIVLKKLHDDMVKMKKQEFYAKVSKFERKFQWVKNLLNGFFGKKQ